MRILMVVALVAAVGCAEKNRDAIEKVKPDYAALRLRLSTLGRKIAAMGPAQPQKVTSTPPPVFDEKGKQFNTDILSVEQLADVYAKPPFELGGEADLVRGLLWTGDHSPAADSMLDRREGTKLEAELRAALKYRYLVVYRTIGLVEPKGIDEHTYSPGHVALYVYLVDLTNDTPQLVALATGKSAPATSYAYKQGEDAKQALAKFAHSTMWESVRADVRAKLPAATGGTFVFDM